MYATTKKCPKCGMYQIVEENNSSQHCQNCDWSFTNPQKPILVWTCEHLDGLIPKHNIKERHHWTQDPREKPMWIEVDIYTMPEGEPARYEKLLGNVIEVLIYNGYRNMEIGIKTRQTAGGKEKTIFIQIINDHARTFSDHREPNDIAIRLRQANDEITSHHVLKRFIEKINDLAAGYGFKIETWGDWPEIRKLAADEEIYMQKITKDNTPS